MGRKGQEGDGNGQRPSFYVGRMERKRVIGMVTGREKANIDGILGKFKQDKHEPLRP